MAAAVALLAAALIAPASASAGWEEPSPVPLNYWSADSLSITSVGTVPYVAWHEASGIVTNDIRVSRLTGDHWDPVGGALNINAAATPSISVAAGRPYFAWSELDSNAESQIRVKGLSNAGSGWDPVGGLLNPGYHPSIAGVAGVPYVASASAGQIRVKRFASGAWAAVGGSLNVNSARYADNPSVANVGGVPYVAWQQRITGPSAARIYVKRFTGGAWRTVGAALNANETGSGENPSITSVGGVPYVAWQQLTGGVYRVRVKRYTGGAWTFVGGSLNVNAAKSAQNPSITSIGGAPYVAWDERKSSASQIHVKRFSAGAWSAVGGSLNLAPARAAADPRITGVAGVPYVAWREVFNDCVPKCAWNVYVKRYEP